MNPFAPNPGSTPPPTSIPQVDVPLPNFQEVGAQVAKGAKDSGFWAGIWEGLLSILNDIIATWIAAFLGLYAYVGQFIVARLIQAEEIAAPEFDKLSRLAIKDVFGVDVAPGAFEKLGSSGSRVSAANNIGAAVMRGMFDGLGGDSGTTLQPSSSGAEKAVALAVGMSIEGWTESWICEALSLGQLEKFGDLDDKLKAALGLGRLTSRMLRPAADVLVGTPFEWKINKLYRPRLLTVSESIRQYVRGRWSREKLVEELARQGYSDERIEALINSQRKFFSPAELDYLIARGIWDKDRARQHLMDQGWERELADAQLALEADRRLDVYRRQYAAEAVARFVEKDIDGDQFRNLLEQSRLPDREQDYIRILAGLKRELRTKSLTLSEIRECVERGILTLADFRAELTRQGYSFEDARTLELLFLSKVKDSREAAAAREKAAAEREAARKQREAEAAKKRAETEGELAAQGISLGQFERAVKAGVRTLDEYAAFLRAAKYGAGDVELLTDLLAAQLEKRAADEARREELRRQAAVKQVNLADIEASVKRGILTVDEYTRLLALRGFGDEDRALLRSLLEADLAAAREAEARRAEAQARFSERELSLTDFERAVRLGLRSIESYADFLSSEGFDDADRATLVGLLEAAIAADDAARKRREDAAARAAAKQLSISDLERAVRAGVRTVADYRQALLRAGFTTDDVDALQRLLELDVESDKAAAKAREAAAAAAAEKRISLSDLERAVKLGVVPISSYQEGLKRAGVPAGDQEILTLSLVAELKAARDAQARRDAARVESAARELSLAQFERAVREGLRSVGEYRLFLEGEGFTASDAATLAGLVQLQLSQEAAAKARRDQVAGELAARRISLGDFEAAVKKGVRTMAEYRAFLEGERYSAYDVATLTHLLSVELAELAERA